MRIWKFTLAVIDDQSIVMPSDAKLLSVQVQFEMPQLWALVDEEGKRTAKRHFQTYGTGHPMPNNPGIYIGTYQLKEGALVFHVFEVSR